MSTACKLVTVAALGLDKKTSAVFQCRV